VPDYRLFELDGNGHVVAPSKVLRFPSDEEVIEKAKSIVNGLYLEIWDSSRVVARIASRE
jgi:hypothetical protein